MKKLLTYLGIIIGILLILSFMPINTSKYNSLAVSGIVDQVSEQGYKDACFKLKGSEKTYYINRGLVNQFTLNQLKDLEGQKVNIMYARYWSPLAILFAQSWHITELKQDAKVLYSE